MTSTQLGTIEEEAAACRAAFEGVGVGTPVWCCHHEIELEWLTELPEKRIRYIISMKPTVEQARRLREFRPVRGPLPTAAAEAWKSYIEARKAYDETGKAYFEARKAYDETGKAYFEAWKAREEAWKAYDEAWKAYGEAWKAHQPEITVLHRAECPWTTWDGTSIFGART